MSYDKARTPEENNVYTGYPTLVEHLATSNTAHDTAAGTKACGPVRLVLDRTKYLGYNAPGHDDLLMPRKRFFAKDSAVPYAVAESLWYAEATRNPASIIPYGAIWSRMCDATGKVNSNYGYQIKESNGAQFMTLVKELDRSSKSLLNTELPDKEVLIGDTVTFMIANGSNCTLRADTVCNNAIRMTPYIDKTAPGDRVKWYVQVLARSLDLIYGYPYDVFAAQGFTHYVASLIEALNIETDKSVYGIDVTHVDYTAVNAHIYDSALAKTSIDDLCFDDMDAWSVTRVDASMTGYDIENMTLARRLRSLIDAGDDTDGTLEAELKALYDHLRSKAKQSADTLYKAYICTAADVFPLAVCDWLHTRNIDGIYAQGLPLETHEIDHARNKLAQLVLHDVEPPLQTRDYINNWPDIAHLADMLYLALVKSDRKQFIYEPVTQTLLYVCKRLDQRNSAAGDGNCTLHAAIANYGQLRFANELYKDLLTY